MAKKVGWGKQLNLLMRGGKSMNVVIVLFFIWALFLIFASPILEKGFYGMYLYGMLLLFTGFVPFQFTNVVEVRKKW